MIDIQLLNFEAKDLRFERKWFVERLSLEELQMTIKLHPAMFSGIFYPRYINNIYFDSFDKKSYFETVNGLYQRVKVRIRWYGDLFGRVASPILELKIKNSLTMHKVSYPLKSFIWNEQTTIADIRDVFASSEEVPAVLRQELKGAEFALLNRYRREYFLSADKKYRVTLDNDLIVYHLSPLGNTFMAYRIDHNAKILELKYAQADAEEADRVAGHFPFRMTKSSKYVSGVDRLTSFHNIA